MNNLVLYTWFENFSRRKWDGVVIGGYLLHSCSVKTLWLKEEYWVVIFDGGE